MEKYHLFFSELIDGADPAPGARARTAEH